MIAQIKSHFYATLGLAIRAGFSLLTRILRQRRGLRGGTLRIAEMRLTPQFRSLSGAKDFLSPNPLFTTEFVRCYNDSSYKMLMSDGSYDGIP